MNNNIYFENYCKKIYNFLFTYINFIIGVKLLGIIIIYYIFRLLKNYNYLILIDEFILYLIHIITIILLLCRFIYIYIIKKHITLSFYKLHNLTYDLFSTYLIGFYYTDSSDIDETDLITYDPDILNKKQESHEFKDLLLFYISFFISIVIKMNNTAELNNYLLNTQIYDNYFIHKIINHYYNYNINTYEFKLYIIEYNIKYFLTKSYNNGILITCDYNKCKDLLHNINEQIRYIYLNINQINDNLNDFVGLYNQQNIIIKLINILNDFLIFISLILTIIYYINYLSHTALIYILILSFLYLYINVIIYMLFNNQTSGLDLNKLLINIHDEINILYLFAHDNIQIIYK